MLYSLHHQADALEDLQVLKTYNCHSPIQLKLRNLRYVHTHRVAIDIMRRMIVCRCDMSDVTCVRTYLLLYMLHVTCIIIYLLEQVRGGV